MEIKIKRASDLSSEEQRQVDERLLSLFGQAFTAQVWAPVDWRVLVWVDGCIASQVEILDRTVTAGARHLRVGGISGVVTLPEYRRRGLSTAALQAASCFLRDALHISFGLLITGEWMIPFYARLGWQPVAGPTVYDQPDCMIVSDGVTMILSLNGDPWPGGPIDLCGLPW